MLRTALLQLLSFACFPAFAQHTADTRDQEYAIILRLSSRYQADSAWTDADKAAAGEHFATLQKLQQQGRLTFAGRTTNKASVGFIILKNMTEAEARSVMADDKAVQRGIMIAELQPFYTALKEKK